MQRGHYGGSVGVVCLRMSWKHRQGEHFQLCQFWEVQHCALPLLQVMMPALPEGPICSSLGCLFVLLECSFSSCARGKQVSSIWVRPSVVLLSCRDISEANRSRHNYQGTFPKPSGSFVLRSSLRCALGRLMSRLMGLSSH